jgi:hypothetical protein
VLAGWQYIEEQSYRMIILIHDSLVLSNSRIMAELIKTEKHAPEKLIRFPTELLLKIFQYAVHRPFWQYETAKPNRDAWSIARVCKSFHKPAIELMYTDVVIPNNSIYHPARWDTFLNHSLAVDRCEKPTIECSQRPPLSDFDLLDRLELAKAPIDQILPRFKKLRCLEDSTPAYFNYNNQVSIREQQLQRLPQTNSMMYANITTFIYDRLFEAQFKPMVTTIPTLKRLLVRGPMTICKAECLQDKSSLGILQEFHVARLEGNEVGIWRLLAWPRALTHLSFGCIAPFEDPMANWYEVCDVRPLMSALKHHQTSLKYLSLSRHQDICWWDSPGLSVASFSMLEVIHVHKDHILDFVADNKFCLISPKLDKIILSVLVQEDGSHAPVEVEIAGKFMLTIIEHVEALKTTEATDAMVQVQNLKTTLENLWQQDVDSVMYNDCRAVVALFGIEFVVLEYDNHDDLRVMIKDSFNCALEV